MSSAAKGYLFKQGQLSVKKRWFVLEGNILSYYGNEEESVPRGQLVLDASCRLVASPEFQGFTIHAHRKTWTVSREGNEIEYIKQWCAAIDGAITCAPGSASETTSEAMDTDDENTHTVTVSGTDFVLTKRYDNVRPLGHGAYGVVVSATDLQSGVRVAIKKCPNVFEDLLDAKRIAREIRLMRYFNHPNIIKISDLLPPPAVSFTDVYIVAELMDTDLHRVIYSGQKLSEEHIQFFLYQMLCGIQNIHSASVIHRDLKPSNILLNENCDLKICDFGLARDMGASSGHDLPSNLTEYVVTRWYRAPEIMLSSQEYSRSIDIWAVGCIFGEMLGRKPMFPGNDYIHQLKLITKALGTPTCEEDLWFVKNPKAKLFMLQLPPNPPQDLSERFPEASAEALDLLRCLLQLDYQKRYTVEQALNHPFFADVRDAALEDRCPAPVEWGKIETSELSRQNLQMMMLEDIRAFHPEVEELLMEQQRLTTHAGKWRASGQIEA